MLLISTVAVLLALHFVPAGAAEFPDHQCGTTPAAPFRPRLTAITKKILARNGITLKIVTSEGSLDNLNRLTDGNSGVDVAFVQSGHHG